LSPRVAQALERGLSHPVTRSLLIAGVRLGSVPLGLARRMKTREIECEATTLSAALRQHAIESVDLVKVDVEGAEMDVLEGVADADWSRLRQMVIEVHDVDGRLDKIRTLLETKAFAVAVEQEDWATLRLRGLHNVYARRDEAHMADARRTRPE
jgi:hypothetical protein